jgi:DNA-binding IclR family transcriptional regulator
VDRSNQCGRSSLADILSSVDHQADQGRNVESEGSERGSQAVHRVLRVLLCWQDDATLSLTEIAQRTGLTLPTAHRMIRALQRESFLVHDRVSGLYALGPAIFDLARTLLERGDSDELVVVVMPHLERIRSITGESVGLHLLIGDLRICVAELVSRQPVRTATGVGRTFKLPDAASGKILVAWSPERVETINRLPGATRRAREQLLRVLTTVREQGYAISKGETIPGASALALPVFGPYGDIRAAINVTGPSSRWTEELMMSHLPTLKAEVAQISEQLGYRIGADGSTEVEEEITS